MRIQPWVVVNSNGSVFVRKNKPDTAADEVPIKLDIEVPDELFQSPILEASIEIEKEDYMTNPITGEVKNNIKNAIKQSTGLDFNINVIEHEEEDEDSI